MSNVLGMVPPAPAKSPVIIGLIPCWNRFFLDPMWTVVCPGVEELSKQYANEFDPFEPYWVWQQIYSGQFQLYVGYTDKAGTATPEKFQEMFVEKIRTPDKDFIGFFILDVFRKKAVHVFAAYIMPEFRDKGVFEIAYDYIESQVKAIGAKELTATVPNEVADSMRARGYRSGLTNMKKILA